MYKLRVNKVRVNEEIVKALICNKYKYVNLSNNVNNVSKYFNMFFHVFAIDMDLNKNK